MSLAFVRFYCGRFCGEAPKKESPAKAGLTLV
jgi:hypothetical protein